jgi:arylsulfatase A-like enzyme
MKMLPLKISTSGLLLFILSIASSIAQSNKTRPPNLIYIMADDLGYGDLGCFGQKTIKTPNLDKMASEGLRFTSYYAGNTVCRPSRLSLWTGKHMGHTPISSNANYHFKPSDITVSELLKSRGYATGGVGKWAMGGIGTTGHPNKNGFDFWFGYLDQGEAHNYYPTHLWKNTEKITLKGNTLTREAKDRGRVSKNRVTYSHDLLTTQAMKFIADHKNTPFLLHVHWTIPHANNEGGRATGDGMEVPDYGIYAKEKWPNTKKGAAAMITRMDQDVGKIIQLIKKLDIQNETMIFFTSDNGPHSEGGHKHETFNANGPLRGYKRDLYEGGIRVPGIAYWPNKIKPGTESDQPFAFWDWLPTACELAGITPPTGLDGLSFAPTLLGKLDQQKIHPYLFWKYGSKIAIRKQEWKAVRNSPNKRLELYNLKNDIGETKNLSAQYPDKISELEKLIEEAVK